jgi:2-C-methyl-D-erythritol 4-phosphate cytidylyltransferase / 2-C-methyl-D-erythritol 2,4-cyclodiphosphate synthase
MRAVALLLAAGRGERLAGDRPKAFLELGGRTLVEHAVAAVEACPDVEGHVVAAPAGWKEEAERIGRRSEKHLAVVPGGPSRRASVGAALAAVPEGFDAVICHDVARPLASPKLFSTVLAPLERAEGAIPVLPISDTVKRVAEGVVMETVPREGLALAQTPQAFRREALQAAYERDFGEATDDAILLERAGFRVAVVAGEPSNLKITVPEDLRLARALLDDG